MSNVSLLEAARRYVDSLDGQARARAQAEVNRFVRWYGAGRTTGELRGHDVSLYGEELGASSGEARRRADQVRGFLAFLKKEGLTEANLAPHLRLRKNAARAAPATGQEGPPMELTASGLEALKRELEALKAERPRVREELRLAMLDKDFRENAPLDAAKEKQGHLESRIRQIEETLKRAVVAEEAREDSSRVRVGSAVAVTNLGTGASQRYVIVGPNEANAGEGKISNASPIGRALLDRAAGEEVRVSVPAGELRLRIEAVEG